MDPYSRSRTALTGEQIREVMNRITTYDFNGHKIRVVAQGDDRWMVFADVCRVLGYKNPSHEAKSLHPREKAKLDIGLRNTLALCVCKSGLYIFSVFSGKRDATVHDVLHQGEGTSVPQFSTIDNIHRAEPTEAQYDAIYAALYGESILPADVVFFSRDGENDRVWGKIGDHVFCREYIWE